MKSVNIIGAGRLGKTLGRLIATGKYAEIQAVCNNTINSSISATKFIQQGVAVSDISELPQADITLISVPDDKIYEIAKNLAGTNNIKKGSTVFHCSGSLSSSELIPLKTKSCGIASIHPMHSFASPDRSVKNFVGTYCAIEGDSQQTEELKIIFEEFGAKTYFINKEKKKLYHASGVIASNYVVTLCELAKSTLISSGVEDDIAIDVILSLMSSTLGNLSSSRSPTQSLTGPIKRGDISTVLSHLDSLEGESKKTYSQLARETLKIANLHETKKAKIERILDNSDNPNITTSPLFKY